MRIEASRELVAPVDDVWALLAEPAHLADWWPGYASVRADRRGLAAGARWEVVRSRRAGLVRKPGGRGLIVVREVAPNGRLAWHDVQQRFDARVDLDAAGERTHAHVSLEAPWWRIRLEGLRTSPRDALSRLHDLCQTAAGL